jgi:hypothetical protein
MALAKQDKPVWIALQPSRSCRCSLQPIHTKAPHRLQDSTHFNRYISVASDGAPEEVHVCFSACMPCGELPTCNLPTSWDHGSPILRFLSLPTETWWNALDLFSLGSKNVFIVKRDSHHFPPVAYRFATFPRFEANNSTVQLALRWNPRCWITLEILRLGTNYWLYSCVKNGTVVSCPMKLEDLEGVIPWCQVVYSPSFHSRWYDDPMMYADFGSLWWPEGWTKIRQSTRSETVKAENIENPHVQIVSMKHSSSRLQGGCHSPFSVGWFCLFLLVPLRVLGCFGVPCCYGGAQCLLLGLLLRSSAEWPQGCGGAQCWMVGWKSGRVLDEPWLPMAKNSVAIGKRYGKCM